MFETMATQTMTAPALAPVQAGDGERPLERLEAEICDLAAHLAVATCRWLLLVAEFDRRRGWAGWGVLSCAHWLSWKCGISLTTAREQVRVARALETLPTTRAAFGAGRISYSKTRAITRVAAADTETDWVVLATHAPAAHLDRLVRGYHRATTDAADRRAKTRLRWHWEPDGTLSLHARLAPEEGAVVLAALQAATDIGNADPEHDLERSTHSGYGTPSHADVSAEDFTPASARSTPSTADHSHSAGPPSVDLADASAEELSPDNDRPSYTDALVAMAEAYLQHGQGTASGADLHTVLVHVSPDMFVENPAGTPRFTPPADQTAADQTAADQTAASQNAAGQTATDQSCSRVAVRGRRHLDDGPALDLGTLRRILCDTSTIIMLHDTNGSVLNLGRKTRRITSALRRALKERDGGCRFPGCGNRRADAHHIRHWLHGGETCLENLILLCRRHHRMLHDQQFSIATPRPGQFVFLTPGGRRIPPVPLLPQPAGTLEGYTTSFVGITPAGLTPDWHGDPLDLHYAVSVLAAEHQRRRGLRPAVDANMPGEVTSRASAEHPPDGNPIFDAPLTSWN